MLKKSKILRKNTEEMKTEIALISVYWILSRHAGITSAKCRVSTSI